MALSSKKIRLNEHGPSISQGRTLDGFRWPLPLINERTKTNAVTSEEPF